jgi:DNA-binding MarR family transcriptional regulator
MQSNSLHVNDNGIHINYMKQPPKSARSSLVVLSTPGEERIGTWLHTVRTVALLEREIAATLATHDLSLAQFDVLATLRFNEELTQQELAARLLVTKGNICGLLNRLEDAGWVGRHADPLDSRVNRLRLTVAGRKKVDRVIPEHNETVLKLFESLTANEVRQMRGLFTKLEEGLASA